MKKISEFIANNSANAMIEILPWDLDEIKSIICGAEGIDVYCPHCQKDRVFLVEETCKLRNDPFGKDSGFSSLKKFCLYYEAFILQYRCSMNKSHTLTIAFIVEETGNIVFLKKIGQSPTFADIEKNDDIKKYAKILGKSYYSDLRRALGLYSSEIGIGSFIYLRRIFENLVFSAGERAKKNGELLDDIENLRMSEKIKVLKDYLPSFLVENHQIYGIISKGIHELTEDECTNYFPVVYNGIKLILDEEIERKNKDELKKSTKQEIAKIHALESK